MDEQLILNLRNVLNRLYNPEYLRQSPLASRLGVANRRDTPTAMQRIIEDAIAALKPAGSETTHFQRRRAYDLLLFRYIEQFSQKEVATQLGISLRQYQREQQVALELLAAFLEEKYNLIPKAPEVQSGDGGNEPATERTVLDKDNSWLFAASEDKSSQFVPVFQDVVKLLQPLINRYQVSLTSKPERDLPTLSVHPMALREILLNLLSAAIHEVPHGQIVVATRQKTWEVDISIKGSSSTGSENPLSEMESSSIQVAEQLVQLSGGSFSQRRGRNTFRANLLLPALELMPILVVDDSADNTQLLQRYLIGTRYRMVNLNDPKETLDVVEKLQPEIIVLDLMMPGIDGWEVLGRLRNHPGTSQVPIVILTILPQEELALSLGANAFLRKPVTRDKFLAVLDHLAPDYRSESR